MLKLSIFPQAKAHPTKEEKRVEAIKFSSPNLPKTVVVATDDDLINFITNNAWSPSVYKGVRNADNFISCDWLVYDIDEGLTIDGADKILSNTPYSYLILPSPSHTEENHRFRVVLPLAHSILDIETYKNTWDFGAEILKVVDTSCSDCCRAYFGSTTNAGYADFSKDFLMPIKKETKSQAYVPSQSKMINVDAEYQELITQIYGEKRERIPEAVDFFVKNAYTGIVGGWTTALNSFCFSLALSGVEQDVIENVCEQLAPYPLDKKDMYQINKAVRDGHRESEKL